MTISLSNYREWLPFVFIIAGVALTLVAPFLKLAQQRRKNTMKLLASFKASLHEHDLDHWKEIYQGTREGAFAPAGHFMNRLGKPERLDLMWTAGSEDHTAIQRMAEYLEKTCADMLNQVVDIKMMWYEIGQLIEAMHGWLEDIPGIQKDSSFLEEQYPAIKQVFEKYGHRFKRWPYRVYTKH